MDYISHTHNNVMPDLISNPNIASTYQEPGFTYMGPKEGYEEALQKFRTEHPAYGASYTPGESIGPNTAQYMQYRAEHPVDPIAEQLSSLLANQERRRRIAEVTGEQIPVKNTQEAVNAAMKYQAIRGYQNDLQSGKPAAEALARWAPMMFTNAKSPSLSGVGTMIKSLTPTAPKMTDIDAIDYKSAAQRFNAAQAELNKPDSMQDPGTLGRQMRAAKTQMDTIRSKYQTPQIAQGDTGLPRQYQSAPVKEQRQPGQVYQTPKGLYTWTGTGWSAFTQ